MAEKLVVDQQKEIISKVVDFLSHSDPNLYYTDSSTIANMVIDHKEDANLKRNELELIDKLTSKDVLYLMSFNSNCC